VEACQRSPVELVIDLAEGLAVDLAMDLAVDLAVGLAVRQISVTGFPLDPPG
jgi:hypothetical protein